jgi:hypothetical protein
VALSATDLPALLADLRRTKALLTPEELVHRLPRTATSGLPALDELLGGGLPEGKTIAIAAPAGGAATALSLSVLAAFTGTGALAAVVDRGDGFDPASAADAGVELARILWCRPASAKEAVKATDALLASGAFAVVVLDLRAEEAESGPGRRPRREPEPPGAAWLRLSRTVETARARLLVLGGGAGAGAFAAASLFSGKPAARFAGVGPGRTFEGFEIELSLAGNRLGLAPGTTRLAFRAPDHFPGAAAGSASGDPACRGPRGAREEAGDPWELPAETAANGDGAPAKQAVHGADTPGERLRVHLVSTLGERRAVRNQDTAGERRAVREADTAGERQAVMDADTSGERQVVRDEDAPGELRVVRDGGAPGGRRAARDAAAPGELHVVPDEHVATLRRRWAVVERYGR